MIGQWIKSILFFILLMLVGAIFLPIMIIISFFVSENYYYPMVRLWCALVLWLLRIIVGVKYVIHGQENLKYAQEKAVLIVSNHQSTFETFLFPIIFPRYCFVLKKELLKIPVFGQSLSRMNPIAIDRKQGKKAIVSMIKGGKKRKEQGIPIIVFPEGTRVKPTESEPFKNGAFVLAEKLQLPILPIAHNSGLAWSKGKLLKQKGTIEITIGSLIELNEHENATDLKDKTEAWINAHKSIKLLP